MSKADELLRRLNDFRERTNNHGTQESWEAIWMEVRAYLNEKPHAAAEPEQPVVWMYEKEVGRRVFHSYRLLDHDAEWTETPLYASPAQPIARDEQDAKRYRWLKEPPYRWYISVMSDVQDRFPKFCVIGKDLDAAIDAVLKSAGKEST